MLSTACGHAEEVHILTRLAFGEDMSLQRMKMNYIRAMSGGSPVSERARELLTEAGVTVIDCRCAECQPLVLPGISEPSASDRQAETCPQPSGNDGQATTFESAT